MNTIFKQLTYIPLLAGILLAGCTNDASNNPEHKASETPTVAISKSFTLSPNPISKGETLNITLPLRHPANLTIKSPAGIWHIIHSQAANVSLLSDQEFKSTERIELPVATTKGLIWTDGKAEVVHVFDEPGEYTVYFADNLETEPENTSHLIATVVLK